MPIDFSEEGVLRMLFISELSRFGPDVSLSAPTAPCDDKPKNPLVLTKDLSPESLLKKFARSVPEPSPLPNPPKLYKVVLDATLPLSPNEPPDPSCPSSLLPTIAAW